jgi:hypothetical protein
MSDAAIGLTIAMTIILGALGIVAAITWIVADWIERHRDARIGNPFRWGSGQGGQE